MYNSNNAIKSDSLEQFGHLVNGRLNFEALQNETILQGSLTLVCMGDENSVIKWIYSQNLDLSSSEEVNATYYIREYGLSWLKVDDSKQGVYKCQINDISYTVGLYHQIFSELIWCINMLIMIKTVNYFCRLLNAFKYSDVNLHSWFYPNTLLFK